MWRPTVGPTTLLAALAFVLALAGGVRRLRGVAWSLASLALLSALYTSWQPATWPAVDWLRGTGVGVRVGARSLDLLGLGWAFGALGALVAVRIGSTALRLVAAAVLAAVLVLPQGSFSDELVAADRGASVVVLVDDEPQERGWRREQLPPAAPVVRLGTAVRSERVLGAVGRGDRGGVAGLAWAVATLCSQVFVVSRVLLPLAVVWPVPELVLAIVALAPAASLVCATMVGHPAGLVRAAAAAVAVGLAWGARR